MELKEVTIRIGESVVTYDSTDNLTRSGKISAIRINSLGKTVVEYKSE